jgi:hypothetical protein
VTTVLRGAYNALDGSSLAAAHLTGIAALLLEREPGLSPRRVRAFLGTTPRPTKAAGGMSPPAIGVGDACTALEPLWGRRACP